MPQRLIAFFKRIYRPLAPTVHVVKRTIEEYSKDRVLRLGAALAYYTIFSLPLLIIILISLVGLFFGEAAVEGEIYSQIAQYIGHDSAKQVQKAVSSIGSPSENWWAALISGGVLLFGATGVFLAMQEALNMIFGIYALSGGVRSFLQSIIDRVITLVMIIGVGLMLVVSLILNTVIFILSDFILENKKWIFERIPENLDWVKPYLAYFTDYFLLFLNQGLSLAIFAIFFMLIYKILPDAKLRWRHVIKASIFMALFFWVGQFLMSYYINNSGFTSAYGAAGSLIVILIWVYYSSQLIFIGAELIKVFYEVRDEPIKPRRYAHKISKTVQKGIERMRSSKKAEETTKQQARLLRRRRRRRQKQADKKEQERPETKEEQKN